MFAGNKKQFPIFALAKPKNKRLIYFDSAATSQKPTSVIQAEKEWYEKYNANIYRGTYDLAETATEIFTKVREKVAKFIKAADSKSCVFTRGTTEGINLVAGAWAKHNLKSGHTILLTEMEHHANIVPWQILAKEKKLKLKYWPIDKNGELVKADYQKLFKNISLLCLTHVSNVLGTVNPVEKIIKAAHKQGVKVLVDGAQAVPHFSVAMKKIKPDFYVFSAHKLLGPTGVGVLYINPERFSETKTYQGGGEMIRQVSWQSSSYKNLPQRLEAGTPNLAQVYALGKALDYLHSLGMASVKKYNDELVKYAYNELSKIKPVKIYGPQPNRRSGLISFSIANIHPHDLAGCLNQAGICLRAGHHCAQPLHTRLGVPATARISFHIYNESREIDYFIKTLKNIIRDWNKI